MELARKLELIDKQIADANEGFPDDFTSWQNRTEAVLRTIFGENSTVHRKFNDVSYFPSFYVDGMDTSGYQPAGVVEAIAIMESGKLELEISEESSAPAASVGPEPEPATRVFIVHGQDEAKKYELESYLLKLVGEPPVILHQEPNGGRVLIEKLEASAASVGYAVVILTGDDVGRTKHLEPQDDQLRGRQNVVFEMGFFFGLIGRQRVAVLYEEGLEQPSDIAGLVYIPLDAGKAWKGKLASEMNHAGIPIDWAAIVSS